MVKKKSASKRQTLKMKFKIMKRVKGHKKKLRKAENKAKKAGRVKKPKKNPGIPNNWPFKEQLLMNLEAKRLKKERAEEEEKERRRQERAEQRERAAAAAEAAAEAEAEAQAEAEQEQEETPMSVLLDQLRQLCDAADIIVFVLDARDPAGGRCAPLEHYLTARGKRIAFFLTQCEVVPRAHVARALELLEEEGHPSALYAPPTAAGGRRSSSADALLSFAEAWSAGAGEGDGNGEGAAPTTAASKKRKAKAGRKGKAKAPPPTPASASAHVPTVCIAGYPHADPEGVLRALRGRFVHCCELAEPREQMAEQMPDARVRLLDTAGSLFDMSLPLFLARAEAGEDSESGDGAAALQDAVASALSGNVFDPLATVESLMNRCNKVQLMQALDLPSFDGVEDFLKLAARKTSKFGRIMRATTPDGELNLEAAALGVLQSWATGDISFVVKPQPSTTPAPGSGGWGRDAQPLLQALSVAQRDELATHDCVPDDKFDDFIVMEPAAVVPWHKMPLNFDQLLETCRSIEEDDEEEEDNDEEEEDGVKEEAARAQNKKRKSTKSNQAEQSAVETGAKSRKKTKASKSKSAGAGAADDAYDFGQFF